MRLLILTQKVNKTDPILGFFHRWIEGFASECESVTVICLEKGEYSLPPNVSVRSLGKEEGVGTVGRVLNFYKLAWKYRNNYDRVFVHMNPVYVVLGGFMWRLLGKKVALWYTHRHVDAKLRVAVNLSDLVFTASPEGMRIRTQKLQVVGHGIDPSKFSCARPVNKEEVTMLHVGRITKIKNCGLVVDAASLLVGSCGNIRLIFVGEPVTPADREYFSVVESHVRETGMDGRVEFAGSVSNYEIAKQYCASTLTVNAVPTGGMDKAVLESFAAGRPAFTSNRAFEALFGGHSGKFIFNEGDPADLASKIADALANPELERNVEDVRRSVTRDYAIDSLIRKITDIMA